jgi:cobaltochelatase CobS
MRMSSSASGESAGQLPDMKLSVRQVFGIDSDLEVPAYSQPDEHVPETDPDYLFNRDVTLALEDMRISIKFPIRSPSCR